MVWSGTKATASFGYSYVMLVGQVVMIIKTIDDLRNGKPPKKPSPSKKIWPDASAGA